MFFNNYKDLKKFLDSIPSRQTLLLHSCCAPCSSYTLLFLNQYFDITIYYDNDNIFPAEEYYKRFEEQKRLIQDLCLNIEVIPGDYDEKRFLKCIKGTESEPEGGKRCYLCYQHRLNRTALMAKERGFDYFTTTLSISPYKNAKWINEIGYALEKKYQVHFLYSDFKKDEGYKKSIILSQEYHLYRQDYCGCIFSYEAKRRGDLS